MAKRSLTRLIAIYISIIVLFSLEAKNRHTGSGIRVSQAINIQPKYANNRILKEISQVILLPSIFYTSLITPAAVLADSTTTTAEMVMAPTEQERLAPSAKVAPKALNSDEFLITFDDESLGLGLVESDYKGFPVVTVSAIKKTDLVVNHKELRIGAILTAVGDQSTDGIPLTSITKLVKNSPRPIEVKFRDPSRF